MNIAPKQVASLRQAIMEWGERSRRDLPWRHTRDPWAILVSEVMLAQTQVGRVIPRWQEFMARWPTASACAAAPVADVIGAWSGLGYNRRAVLLHRAAVAIATRHQGVVPADRAALLALPGVGAYTARAVLVFAFGQPEGVVETNTARVLARAVAGGTLTGSAAQHLADSMVPPNQSWAWNQTMLDLGATICTSRRPGCGTCPLGPRPNHPDRPNHAQRRPLCAWLRRGGPDPAAGSAGTSRPQSTFAGSDRQGRGRLLAHLADPAGDGRLRPDALAVVAGWPDQPARAARAARSLVEDGLAVIGPDGGLSLPP
jgi:A/G-specific adenine glycosylase